MKVLSLFDGMSCGRIALDRLNIKVDKYYASEIDKHAIKVSQANFPDIIQVGDICNLDSKDFLDVDLILAGSPCQGFSMAGKQLAFDDPRSALFFEFVRLLKDIKPKWFLLENVRMAQEHENVITKFVSEAYEGVDGIDKQYISLFGYPTFLPHKINSSCVSAQSRNRLYWTNIPNIKIPQDKGIVLKDILLDDKEVDLWKDPPRWLKNNWGDKSRASRVPTEQQKANCLTASMSHSQVNSFVKKDKYKFLKPLQVAKNVEKVRVRKHKIDIPNLQHLLRVFKSSSGKTNKTIARETNMPLTKVEHWFRTDSSFAIPSDDVWYKLKEVLGITTNAFDKQILEFEIRDGVYETKQRVYGHNGKSPTITPTSYDQLVGISNLINTQNENENLKINKNHTFAAKNILKNMKNNEIAATELGNSDLFGNKVSRNGKAFTTRAGNPNGLVVKKDEEYFYRKLHPIEVERLQTVPDNYTNHVSKTERFRMLGNGWTVDVICEILKNIKK